MRNFFSLSGAQIRPHADDRRNDFARLFDHDGVADANVFSFDFLFVVQRRARHAAAADSHRFERRDRREHSGATDLDQNIEQLRLDPFGLVLVSDRPARRFGGEAERLALRESIDFHDRAIRLVDEIVPHLIEFVDRVQDLLDRFGHPPALAARQPKFFEQRK